MRIKRLLLLLAFMIGFLPGVMALAPVPAYAAVYDPLEAPCSKPGAAETAACAGRDSTPITGADGIIVKVTRITALFAAIVAVIVIIAYGILMVFSAGDTSKVTSARNAIIAAAAGLVVIGLAQAIVVFIVSRL